MLEAMLNYHSAQARSSSPSTTQNINNNNNINPRRTYPEALPAYLPRHLRATVDGVAVIYSSSSDLRHVQPMLELITPTPLRQSVSGEADTHVDESTTEEHAAQQDDEVDPSRRSASSSPVPECLHTNISPKEAIRAGGCVIFSDRFMHDHPTSPITLISHEYQRVHLQRAHTAAPGRMPSISACETSTPLVSRRDGGGDADDDVMELNQYMMEAMRAERPLFRRQPSYQLYGRGSYVLLDQGDVVNRAAQRGRSCSAGMHATTLVHRAASAMAVSHNM